MGSKQPEKTTALPTPSQKSPRQLELIDRQSPELVLGFSGTIGCGMSFVTDQARQTLVDVGYEVQIIRISNIIEQTANLFNIPVCDDTNEKSFRRYESLQNAGNELRKKFSKRVLAEIAIAQIVI